MFSRGHRENAAGTNMELITCTTVSFSIRLASKSLCVLNFCHTLSSFATNDKTMFTATITNEDAMVRL